MKEIPLTRGFVALIDDADFARVSKHKWHAAIRRGRRIIYGARHEGGDPRRFVYLHRFILGVLDGRLVDHRNGDGLDNRRENLRICTISQNNANIRIVNSKSGFKGVKEDRSSWAAHIRIAGKEKYLGKFKSPVEAARAYDRAAIQHYGEFAATNAALGLLP